MNRIKPITWPFQAFTIYIPSYLPWESILWYTYILFTTMNCSCNISALEIVTHTGHLLSRIIATSNIFRYIDGINIVALLDGCHAITRRLYMDCQYKQIVFPIAIIINWWLSISISCLIRNDSFSVLCSQPTDIRCATPSFYAIWFRFPRIGKWTNKCQIILYIISFTKWCASIHILHIWHRFKKLCHYVHRTNLLLSIRSKCWW